MTVARIASLVLFTLILLSGAGVLAQTSPQPVVGLSAFEGVWEGYDSEGVRHYLVFSRDESVRGVLELGSTRQAPDGELTAANFRFHIEPIRPDLVRLVTTGGSTSIAVNFYSSEGMRLSWPSGRQAVLARSLAEIPDFPPTSAFQMVFTAPIQARILSLSGDWYAQSPEEALGRSVRITVVDPGVGTLVVRESTSADTRFSSALARAAHIAPVQGEQLTLTYDDTSEAQTVNWGSESEISLVGADGAAIVFGRRPPE